MVQEGSDTDGRQSDPAVEAFDALRSDLLARLDTLAEELKGPDYSPTLGAIVQTLQAIEGHPALRCTPQGFAQEMQAASGVVRQQAERELHGATQQLNLAAKDLGSLAAGVRARSDQNRLLGVAFAAGAVLGMLLWACVFGPLARALLASRGG